MSHKIKVCTVLLILAVGLSSTLATFDPDVMCVLVKNGTTLKDPSSCNTWIECVNQVPQINTCGAGLFYDLATNNCVDWHSIKCVSSNACATLTADKGFVADPYSCNGYYYCLNGIGTKGTCSSGLNYNPGTEDCIRNFPCVTQADPDNYCNIVPEGVFIKNQSNCTAWQVCWQGELISGNCPLGYYFDANDGVCDYSELVNCNSNTPEDEPNAKEVCNGTTDIFIATDMNCNGYYYCQGLNDSIILRYGECPTNRFFNASDGGSCVPRTELICSHNRCVDMGFEYIQLANLSNDGCTGFSICQNGVEIGTGSCPQGEYFNEMTQLCSSQVVNFPACAKISLSEMTTTNSDHGITITISNITI